MRLLSLSVTDFRNLPGVELCPSVHATVAVGQNGQGKTNLLEAVYFLCTLKPLRAQKLSELVRFDTARAKVEGRFLVRGAERVITVEVENGKRASFVDGKRAADLEAYFGGVSVVAFTPDDLEVVKGGPDERRRFLDRAVFNRFPAYLAESRSFLRALKSRNRLIKDRAEARYLSAFDDQLALAGARIWVRRRALLAEVAPRAEAAFASIGRTVGEAAFRYLPEKLPVSFSTASEEELCQALRAKLADGLARDLDRGFTSAGPQADDLAVSLGAVKARTFASQGQQRALVLSWKIAEIENLSEHLGHLPLLLLDDVSSELDPERNAYLMEYLRKSGAQTFLTTTEPSLVERAAGADTVWLSVQGGIVASRGFASSGP